MKTSLRITLAQLNLKVGDIQGNVEKLIHSAHEAREKHSSDIIVFPELSLTGYPPEDLLLRHSFIKESNEALQKFMSEVKNIYCLVSHPHQSKKGLYNACSVIHNGKILGQYAKRYLPNYGVFDECRYFVPGDQVCIVPIKDVLVGVVICEDLWYSEPIRETALQGARLILSPNASPFETDKHDRRTATLAQRAVDNHMPIVYVNNVGGQDELVFDGGSMIVNHHGKIAQFAGFFNENFLHADLDVQTNKIEIAATPFHLPSTEEKIYECLVLGVKDYFKKNKIPGALIGASGGIDSALTLAIAVDALGKENVKAIIMPSPYTSKLSMEEAFAVTKNVGVDTQTISIESAYQSFLDLFPQNEKENIDVTTQNIQARCRAIILMALSNRTGCLVLNTGNRSELAVGYCTLYGDMAGGFAVLKDVPKTMVYELAKYRNRISPVIPERTITRPPTAELAPNQKDEDSLPPYSILDPILEAYLNQSKDIDEIVAKGFERNVVIKVVDLIHKNEYKRHQAVIGPHINNKSFGKDWRYPICNGSKN